MKCRYYVGLCLCLLLAGAGAVRAQPQPLPWTVWPPADPGPDGNLPDKSQDDPAPAGLTLSAAPAVIQPVQFEDAAVALPWLVPVMETCPTCASPRQVPNMLGGYLGSSVLRGALFQRPVLTQQTVLDIKTITILDGDVKKTIKVAVPRLVTVASTVTDQYFYRIPAPGRTFRISENESPAPQDRVFFYFNYFDGADGAVNQGLGGSVGRIDVNRETFGCEKAFLDGLFSVGLRVPVNTMHVDDGSLVGLGGSSTDFGDVTLVTKMLLLQTPAGSALSAGLAVTFPTGPNSFSGVPGALFEDFHSTTLQPYLGYIWRLTDNWYIQGFSAVDIPTSVEGVTLMFNDIGIGYFFIRDPEAFISGIAPTVECRVTTPLNHRDAFSSTSVFGTLDTVELTMGGTIEFGRRITFATAVVTPLTGPKPYDFQVLAQLNFRF
jgi:hypothetical protein